MKRTLACLSLSAILFSPFSLATEVSWEEWEIAYHELFDSNQRRALSLLQERYNATPNGYAKLYMSSRLYEHHTLLGQPFYGIRSSSEAYSNQEEQFIAALNSERKLNSAKAVKTYQELLKQASLENNLNGKILFEYHLCRVLNQQGEFHQAATFCNSLDTHIQDSSDSLIPNYKAYRVLANNHEFLGDYHTALNYYQLYLSSIPRYVDASGVYNDAGLLLKEIGNISLAKEYLSIAITLRESSSSALKLAQTYHSMGDILLTSKEYDVALENFAAAEKILVELEHEYGLIYVTLGLGRAHIALNDYASGTQLLLSALEKATVKGHQQLKGEIYLALSSANAQNSKYQTARSFAQDALSLAKENNSLRLKGESLKALAEIAKAEGDFELALDYYQQYVSSELTKHTQQNRSAFLALDTARHELGQDIKVGELEEINHTLEQQLKEASSISHLYQFIIALLFTALALFLKLKRNAIKRAEIDILTGALNRAASIREIKKLPKLDSEELKYAVLLIDLDDFKQINDNYGHPTGDTALASIAATIVEMIEPDDIFGRLGGEEFVIVMQNVDELDVHARIEELHNAIALTTFSAENHEELRLTATFSFLATSKSLADFDELYSILDQALYQAKQNGKNRIIDAFNEPIHLPTPNTNRSN